MLDFSGSGVIHCTGGFVALFATIVLGPRRGRFYDRNGIPRETPGLQKGHSVALQLLGTMILWFGWYGFNPGSALLLGNDMASSIAAHTVLTTTMSAACGALSALFTNAFLVWRKHDEFHLDLVAAMNGLLSGLVAITAGCAFVDPWASVVIGLISGWMYLFGSWALIKLKIDDAVDAIPVHLANGLWGVFAVGLFASPKPVSAVLGNDDHVGIFYTPDDPTLLGAQIVGALFIFAWTLGTMFPFFLVLNYVGWFRVNELEEIVGLDTTYHGKNSLADSCEEASVTDEVERKEAFLQRRRERTKTHSSLNAIIDGSWGELDVSTPGSEDGMALPEQAPQQAKSLLTSNTTSSDTLTGGFPSNSSASRSAPSSFSENDFPSARSPVVRQFAEL
jgi:ammonium transporter